MSTIISARIEFLTYWGRNYWLKKFTLVLVLGSFGSLNVCISIFLQLLSIRESSVFLCEFQHIMWLCDGVILENILWCFFAALVAPCLGFSSFMTSFCWCLWGTLYCIEIRTFAWHQIVRSCLLLFHQIIFIIVHNFISWISWGFGVLGLGFRV